MQNLQLILNNGMFYAEVLAALIGLIFFIRLRKTYWKYFSIYLLLIVIFEFAGKKNFDKYWISRADFYNYLVIPFEFIFLYWLYAWKSLKNRMLFYVLTILYLLSFIPSEMYFVEMKLISSFNYTFGCLLLGYLVTKEFIKQINSPNILYFMQNKMFFINIGITLFYIGSLPFWTFYPFLLDFEVIWNLYYIYFLLSGIIMYLLFSCSILWGKPNLS